jgi:DNA-binding transcriptional LysR family regulator
LELRQLKYFIAVAEEGGFSAAAAMLPVKSQTLLGQIRKLENELGLRLLHREGGDSRLTEAGRIFTRYARKVLSTAEKARQAMDDLKDGCVSGEIRIGTVDSVGIYFLPQVLRNMREKYPGVRLTVLYRNSNEILQALLSNRIDVALVDNPRPDRHLRLETIIEEQVSLVCGRIHPLFGRECIKPKDIEGLRVISLSNDTATGRLVQSYLSRLGIRVKSVASTDNIQTAKKMVEVGFGVTFLPDMITSPDISCQGKSLGRLARIRLNPACNRHIVLATWRRSRTGRSTNSFVEEIRKHSSQWTPCTESGAV